MAKLEKGSAVTFYRSHDPQHQLAGTVEQLATNSDEVLIRTEPIGTLIWANAAHVKLSGSTRRVEDKPAREETAAEEKAREAAEQAEEDAEDVQPNN